MKQSFTIDDNFKKPVLQNRLKVLDIPTSIIRNINPHFELREYQKEAFKRFVFLKEHSQTSDIFADGKYNHLAFNMATGSGKTLIMAGIMLYLYSLGYRNFLFFSIARQIIEKTRDNFINKSSSKYLFNQNIVINNKHVEIKEVENFEFANNNNINICFTSINGLHTKIKEPKENAIIIDDLQEHEIVLLGDEAHHFNVNTKQKKYLSELENWEYTIEKIFKSNEQNMLLEFSATLEYTIDDIYKKYKDKVIYKYDLKEFRNDKFSKNIFTLQSDLDKKNLIIQSIIFNQYKQSIASDYGINLKPVMLFKAVKSIEKSNENQAFFNKILEDISNDEIIQLHNNVVNNKKQTPTLQKAFQYFYKLDNSFNILTNMLKENFNKEKQLNINNKNKAQNQLNNVRQQEDLLNSLEDNNNPIRVVFAVNKLNEGWDVLNLFDIVRLYSDESNFTKSSEKTVKKQTISEAQLIGRGARYFPFIVKDEKTDEEIIYSNLDKYKRKYDNNSNHNLKVLEDLYYHSIYDSEFIDKLNNELENQGLLDNPNQYIEIKMDIRETQDIKNFIDKEEVITNKQIKKRYDKFNLWDYISYGKNGKNFEYKIPTGAIVENQALNGQEIFNSVDIKHSYKTILIKDLPYNLKENALLYNNFFDFDNLKHKFKNVKSVKDFIEKHLDTLEINFIGSSEDMKVISSYETTLFSSLENYIVNNIKKQILTSLIYLLNALEKQLLKQITNYQGTTYFKEAKKSRKYFQSLKKKVKLDNGILLSNLSNEQKTDIINEKSNLNLIKNMNCFLYTGFVGTSEEVSFVKTFKTRIFDILKNKGYTNIILARNDENQPEPVRIYNFCDGTVFYPDFLLFMKDKDNKDVNYQVFIEPKGRHIAGYDEWKNKVLEKIQETYINKEDNSQSKLNSITYNIIALPFYNKDKENTFIREFEEIL